MTLASGTPRWSSASSRWNKRSADSSASRSSLSPLRRQHDLGRFLADLLEHARPGPFATSRAVYDSSGGACARSRDRRARAPRACPPPWASRRRSRCARRCGTRVRPARRRAAARPVAVARATSTTRSVFPEVSPFRQSAFRLRLQKCARPVSAVLRHGFGVGARQHQHVPARAVLRHDGHEPVRVEERAPRAARRVTARLSCGRTAMPAARRTPPSPRGIRISPKWNTEAASAALAAPSVSTSAMCATLPQPPEATTGTRHRLGHRARERHVEAVLGAVAVHAGEQDLAGAARRTLARPGDRVPAGRRCGRRARRPPSPSRSRGRRSPAPRPASRSAAPARSTSDASWTAAVFTATLSAPARSSTSASSRTADAAADGERQVDRVGHAPHHVDHDRPRVRGGGDVEEHELVGARRRRSGRRPPPDRPRRAATRSARP